MLLKFTVSNYRSIDEKQVFSMFAGATRRSSNSSHVKSLFHDSINILKGAAIYGANAGGKTSFIDAITFSKNKIVNDENLSPRLFKDWYCRVSPANKDRETYFEYMFTIKNRCFFYGFSMILSTNAISKEWLYEYIPEKNKEIPFFERDCSSSIEYLFGDQFKKNEEDSKRLEVYKKDLPNKKSSLFLSDVGKKSIEPDDVNFYPFKLAYTWFKEKLIAKDELQSVPPSKKEYTKSVKWLNAFGTDISGVVFKEVESTEDVHPFWNMEAERYFSKHSDKKDVVLHQSYCYMKDKSNNLKLMEILTTHNSSPSNFHFYEESGGIGELLYYLPLLGGDDDRTFIIDEYGRLMHPFLAHDFIKGFYKLGENSSNQLIVATHHTFLLTLELYRRDEIWFIDKIDGKSILYSLEEFQERFDKKIDKAYLEGRYGALPLLNEIDVDNHEN